MDMRVPLSVYLPLRVKLLVLGAAGVVVIVGVALPLAAGIDWAIGAFR